jgi:hypothetical protein
MPTVNSSSRTLAGKFLRLADAVPAQTLLALKASALEISKAVALASGKYATRPITKVTSTFGTLAGDPVALVRMSSPKAHLLDHDTKAHEIQPGAVTQRRTRSPVLFNAAKGFGPVSGSVPHTGTKGKQMWEKGLIAALPVVQETMNGALGNALIQAFGSS